MPHISFKQLAKFDSVVIPENFVQTHGSDYWQLIHSKYDAYSETEFLVFGKQ